MARNNFAFDVLDLSLASVQAVSRPTPTMARTKTICNPHNGTVSNHTPPTPVRRFHAIW